MSCQSKTFEEFHFIEEREKLLARKNMPAPNKQEWLKPALRVNLETCSGYHKNICYWSLLVDAYLMFQNCWVYQCRKFQIWEEAGYHEVFYPL